MQYNKVNQEQWKYTKISNFNKFDFNCKKSLLPNKQINIQNNKIDIQNRIFDISHINQPNIIITDLKSALKNNFSHLSTFFNQIIKDNNNPYVELNRKNYTNGLFIYIKDNTQLNNPLIIKTNSKKSGKNVMKSERFYIRIGKNVSATIFLEEKITQKCNLNTVTEFFIDKNSNLDLIHFSDKPNVTQIYNLASLINNNSTLRYIPIDISGKLIKKNFYFNLKQSNSSCYFESLNVLNGKNYIDNFISIIHSKKNTYSSANHKNILSDKSTGVFYAKTTIKKNSKNSKANQNNKNLMLSNKATVHSNPQLEIYNNDVKCSHGSTTGEIDRDALFYMRSRGISPTDCKKIILKGFADEIINRINNNYIKDIIIEKINTWFTDVN